MKTTLTVDNQRYPVSPQGVRGIKVVQEKENDRVYYRRKLSGTLLFLKQDYERIKLIEGCCKTATLAVERDCSETTPFVTVSLNSNKLEWDFSICQAKTTELETADLYKGVYRNWEKKVNMLTVPADLAISHPYRRYYFVQEGGQTVQKSVDDVKLNNRFRKFNTWLYYLIQQTFTGTAYASLIPTAANFSTFFTATINPVTQTSNIFLRAGIIQASDFCTPDSSQSATGVLLAGGDNEAMAVNLKEVLEELLALFDCEWFIDPITNKFRIEHRLYFVKGWTFGNPTITLDLTQPKYSKNVQYWKGSYKLLTDKLPGIQELIMQGNQTLNNSEFAYDPINQIDYTLQFAKVNDFELGNIKYESDCANTDEKGAYTKETRTGTIFYTHVGAARINDASIDLTKWFLVEYKEEYQFPVPGKPSIAINRIVAAKAERRNVTIENGNFTATALVRDFHRHARPFGSGLMNYGEKVASEKGYYRQMYSVVKNKLPEKIKIPFCCGDTIEPTGLIKLPNGVLGEVKTLTYSFADETLEIEVLTDSACGGTVVVPDPTQQVNCPEANKELYREPITVECSYWTDYPGGNYRVENTDSERVWFADGYCGKYYRDINPCSI